MKTVCLRVAAVLWFLAAGGTVTSAEAQGIAVPSYVQPGSTSWQTWAAYPQAAKIMIVNLNNGDDLTFQPAVQSAVQLAQASGISVFGYTYTGYGQRDPNVVKAAIDAARANYGVTGIFLDEAPTDCTASTPFGMTTFQYYQDLSTYIHSSGGTTVLNPGAVPPTNCWMSIADILVTYENRGITNYVDRYTDLAWMYDYSADHFWHLLYGVKQQIDMQTAFKLATQRNAGWIYVTSDGDDGNPWNGIPTYWTREVRKP